MSAKPSRFCEFGPFRVNATERLLQCRNKTIALTPKVMDTLIVLLENRGHILTKQELLQAVWPDTFVEESSISQSVSVLRRALGEASDGEIYIETVPKRGYRFIAEVMEYDDAGSEAAKQEKAVIEGLMESHQVETVSVPVPESALHSHPDIRRIVVKFRLPAAVFIALVIVSSFTYLYVRGKAAPFIPKTVAVLPFKIVGEQNDPEQLSLGMADALIIRLCKLDKPVVLPTSSISRYTSGDQDALLIGKELGVDGVITGTLQRDGQRIRVNAQLIRLSDGKTVWSGRFDEDFHGNFALQDSISNQIAGALVKQIAQDSPQRLTTSLTQNSDAYQAYTAGLYFWNRRTKENLVKAIQYLEQAISKDPGFARAHAMLADCYYVNTNVLYQTVPTPEAMTRANEEATKALSLDDELAEAHTVKAGIYWWAVNYDEADREFRRALELNPNYAVAHLRYAYFLFACQQLAASLSQMKRSQELDPVSPTSNTALGFILYMSRDYEGAKRSYEKALELQPELNLARFNLVEIYVNQGRFKEAAAEIDKVRDAKRSQLMAAKAYLYIASGRRNEALKIVTDLQHAKDATDIRALDYLGFYAFADKNTAFTWLEKVAPTRFNMARLKLDPSLDGLRTDPRFDDFLKRHL
ncbi:MAG TPA: tetratricopeptide repeat protein [Pyrinomonadaceae bacterium]|nr:tetratricopeptide repeat protein [Pyrinomonadaceae bacterium]